MKHLHRSHVAPLAIDSNSAQFERQGNPWDGLTVTARKKARKAAKRAMPTSRPAPKPIGRSECQAFAEYQADQKVRAFAKAALGLGRVTAPAQAPAVKPGFRFLSSRNGEMEPLSVEAYLARQAMALLKHEQSAERAAYHANIAAKERRAAEEARLARIFANIGDFSEAMSEAMGD